MTLAQLRDFFMWCAILNIALMAVSFVIIALARDWIYRFHGRWFPMPKDTFHVVLYSFLGVYKLLIWVFNIIPFLALAILT